MSVLVIYKSSSEHGRQVEEFLHDFERRTSRTLEIIDPESRRGVDICRLYDVVRYPTVLALNRDGQLRSAWSGLPLPMIDEVSYYVD